MDYTLKCDKYDGMNDRVLVESIIKEEKDAEYCLFYHKLTKFFKFLSYRFSKLRLSVDDIASEIYIFLKKNNWEKLRTFEFRCPFLSWIKTVANRYLLNKVKATSPYELDIIFFTNLIKQDDESEYEYNPAENIPDPNQRLIEELRENTELIEELYRIIDLLSDYAREVVRLRGLAGLSSKETAEILCKSGKNVTPGAVDQVYKRAKDVLREKLRDWMV